MYSSTDSSHFNESDPLQSSSSSDHQSSLAIATNPTTLPTERPLETDFAFYAPTSKCVDPLTGSHPLSPNMIPPSLQYYVAGYPAVVETCESIGDTSAEDTSPVSVSGRKRPLFRDVSYPPLNHFDANEIFSIKNVINENNLTVIEDPYLRFRSVVHDLMNVVNLGDASAIKALLIRHCSVDAELTIKYKSIDKCPYSSCNFLEVCGSHAIAIFFENCLVAIPDSRINSQPLKLKVSVAGLVIITCNFAFTGTKTLVLACDRSNSLIESSIDRSSTNTAGAKVLIQAIGENRNKLITDNPSFPSIDRMIVGSLQQSVSLKLFGVVQITFHPTSGLIMKIIITHSYRKR